MLIRWTNKALIDAERLYLFLAQYDPDGADKFAFSLRSAPDRLLTVPRFGERVEGHNVREVRKLSVGRYVIHYELRGEAILILRIWHSREVRR